jgi:hypothetical protein
MTPGATRQVFQDVALAFGGGANLFATSHIAIQPGVQVFVVTTASDHRWVPVYAVNLAYHFDAHTIQ